VGSLPVVSTLNKVLREIWINSNGPIFIFLWFLQANRSEEINSKILYIKKVNGPDLSRPSQNSAGPAQKLAQGRAGAGLKRWPPGPAGQPHRWPNRYGATGTVRSSRDQWLPVVSFLWPWRRQAETLMRTDDNGGSPGGLPRRWGGDGAARRTTATPGVVNINELSAGMQICTTAMEELDRGLQGSRLWRPWVKERVRLVSYGLGECKQEEREGGERLDQWHSSLLPCIAKVRVSFLLLYYRAKGWSPSSGRVRWSWGSRMEAQRRAGGARGVINWGGVC
jgi:hypothetical protein